MALSRPQQPEDSRYNESHSSNILPAALFVVSRTHGRGMRCRACNGYDERMHRDLSSDERIAMHATRCYGCPWLLKHKGISFLRGELGRMGLTTFEQALNATEGVVYNGDTTNILMSFNIGVKGPHDEKSRVAIPLIPADKIVWPKFEKYSLADKRRESFQTYPTMNMMITGCQLSLCGFFFTGESDEVQCFWCGGKLRGLNVLGVTADNIHTVHAREFYGCPLVASVRGTDFVYSAFMSADIFTKQRARDRINLVAEQQLQDLPDDGLVVQMELVKYVDNRIRKGDGAPISGYSTESLLCKLTTCQSRYGYAMTCGDLVCADHISTEKCLVCGMNGEELLSRHPSRQRTYVHLQDC